MIIVTGASRGLGRAVAERLIQSGEDVGRPEKWQIYLSMLWYVMCLNMIQSNQLLKS